MTATQQDEKIMQLIEAWGMRGYGAYWSILETIAAQTTGANNKTFSTFSEKVWRKVSGFSANKLKNFLVFLHEIELFEVEQNKNQIRISCPNLLKYRDEYTKKKNKNPDNDNQKIRTQSGGTPASETEDRDRRQKTETDKDISDYVTCENTEFSPEVTGQASPKKRTLPACPYSKLVDLYHEHCPANPQCYEYEAFKPNMRARWRHVLGGLDPPDRTTAIGLKLFRDFFMDVGESDFLTGQTQQRDSRRPFVATLDWLLRPNNFAKVVNGNYRNKKGNW